MGVSVVRIAVLSVMWVLIYSYATWWVMLMTGIAHAGYEPIPPLGYWQLAPIVIGLGSVVAAPVTYFKVHDAIYDD